MTLDEIIIREEETAKFNRECSNDKCNSFPEHYRERAKYHEMIVEWLKELKKYRAIGTVEEFRAAVDKKKNIIKQLENLKDTYGYSTGCKTILKRAIEIVKGGGVND